MRIVNLPSQEDAYAASAPDGNPMSINNGMVGTNVGVKRERDEDDGSMR